MEAEPAIERYLAEARTWELDRAMQAQRSSRLAWTVALAAGLIALVAVGAVAGLTPLKQPVPVVIRVDSSSGIVDVVPTYEGTTDIEQVVTRHLLHNYVIARERYFYGTAEADYELVAAENAPRLNQEWAALWSLERAESPLNLYKDGTTVRAQVRSITFLQLGSGREHLAQVRFSRYTRAGGTGAEQASHWVSTIEYGYAAPSKDDKTRTLNPLGFRVLEYRRESEVLATSASSTQGTPP